MLNTHTTEAVTAVRGLLSPAARRRRRESEKRRRALALELAARRGQRQDGDA